MPRGRAVAPICERASRGMGATTAAPLPRTDARFRASGSGPRRARTRSSRRSPSGVITHGAGSPSSLSRRGTPASPTVGCHDASRSREAVIAPRSVMHGGDVARGTDGRGGLRGDSAGARASHVRRGGELLGARAPRTRSRGDLPGHPCPVLHRRPVSQRLRPGERTFYRFQDRFRVAQLGDREVDLRPGQLISTERAQHRGVESHTQR